MFIRFLSATMSFLLVSSCGGQSTFKGDPKSTKPPTKATAEAAPEPVEKIPPSTETIDEVTKNPPVVPPPVIIPPDPIQIPKVCKEKLNYDPSDILCSLAIDGSQPNVWDGKTSRLLNQKAHWINPVKTDKNSRGQDQCPFVPGGEQVIYVSNITLASEDEVTIETFVDDEGQIRLWKNADPKQEVYISTRGEQSTTKMKLPAGFYTVVIDVVDVYKGASGAVASILDSKGAVMRQTEASAEWCIFRLTATQNIADFLLSAAACKSCMIGTSANNLPK